MKRLMYLAATTMVATIMMASVAAAQGVPPDGSPNRYGCPDGYPFVATPAGEAGEAGLLCFATQAAANEYSETGGVAEEPPVSEEPMAPETQYETPTAPETPQTPETTQPLPDTGGASLLLPAAGLLLCAGLLGLRIARK